MLPEPTCFCLCCNQEIPEADDVVPPTGDDAAWAELAAIHAEDCEWVRTRAHRRNLRAHGIDMDDLEVWEKRT